MRENMSRLFSDTTQIMERIEKNNNSVVFSSLSEFYEPVQSTGFAIKYVAEGTERYTLNDQSYHVSAGNYLLCNSTKQGHVEIESRKKVKGICINIIPELIQEAVASLQRPDTFFPDAELGLYFSTPYFLENQFDASSTQVGKLLQYIEDAAGNNKTDPSNLSIEFFYSLSEKIIADQLPVFKQLQSLPGVKAVTKKELYKRISKGREFIDNTFLSPITIELVAKEACMSEYHFFRLFKKMMGVSPHQYILRKRLELGKELMQQQLPVSNVAIECGFTDIFSFSKSFKSYFGYSPSSLLKK